MISAYFRWISSWRPWERKVKPVQTVPNDFLENKEKHLDPPKDQQSQKKDLEKDQHFQKSSRLSIWV